MHYSRFIIGLVAVPFLTKEAYTTQWKKDNYGKWESRNFFALTPAFLNLENSCFASFRPRLKVLIVALYVLMIVNFSATY